MNARQIGLFVTVWLIEGSFARTFTHRDGRTVEADFVSANEKEVMVRLSSTGRLSRFALKDLSPEDVAYVVERKKIARARAAISRFVLSKKGKQVGNGECWTLANEAFKAAGIKRPGKDIRVWGRLVDWKNEDLLPGDILELRSARFSNRIASGPEHTAVVIKTTRRKGMMIVYHQNWGAAGKKVSQATFDLNTLVEGEGQVFRHEGSAKEEIN